MVCIIYIKFKLKEEKPNDTLRPLYMFLNAMHLNLREKGHFDMSNWLFPSFQNFARPFLLFILKKKDNNTIFHFTSSQHNPPMRNVMRISPVPRIM